MGDLGRGLEGAAVEGVERDATFDRERVARFLQRHGVDPDSIDYDPDAQTGVHLVQSGANIHLDFPLRRGFFRTPCWN